MCVWDDLNDVHVPNTRCTKYSNDLVLHVSLPGITGRSDFCVCDVSECRSTASQANPDGYGLLSGAAIVQVNLAD